MEGGNNQVRMNLDSMKTAMEACEATATTVKAVIGDVQTTLIDLEDDFIGEDADTLQDGMKSYLDNQVNNICLNAKAMKKALEQGLEKARYCKNYCQHFVDALNGGANEATNDNEEIPGAMFCDYDVIEGLMEMCTEAERLGEEIRQSTYKIDNVVNLEVVSFDVTYYTSAVREECDKIDRLGTHRRNLENYASFVENTDAEFAGALGGIYDTFMNPKSVERRKLKYGSIDVKIGKMQANKRRSEELRIEILIETMDKSINSITEDDRRAMDEILTELIENGEIKELKMVIYHMGDSVEGTWTVGEAYVAAKIIIYSENTGNEELAKEIYNKLKKEKVNVIKPKESVHTNAAKTIYEYELSFDSDAVAKILQELDPEKNSLAYYSLQKRSMYSVNGKKIVHGILPESIEFGISFKAIDGRLTSIFEVDGKTTEIASENIYDVVGKEEIEKILAMGYTYKALAAGLSSTEIENLERRGVHLTQVDIQNICSTMYNGNVKLSSDYKAVIYGGKVYYIDVPTDNATFEPIWNKDGTKEFSQMKFDLVAGILGIELEEVPKRTVIEEKKGGIHVVREREVYSNDKNVNGAVALSLLTGLTSFIENSLSSTFVEMEFESYGDSRRVRIYVGDSKTRMNMQNINFNIPRNIYALNSDNVVLVTMAISDATKSLYQNLTGEEVPNPNGYYTVVANLNEERRNMIYSGYLSYSEENELLYTPYVFPDEEAHISECTFLYGFEKEKIYDCTELLKQTTKVPTDMQRVMEAAWEDWGDE